MRLALFNAIYPTPNHPKIVGGAEVFVRQFAEYLVSACNYEVQVFRFSPTGRYEVEVVGGVTVHFLPVRNLFPPFQDQKNALSRSAWHLIDDWQTAGSLVGRLLAEFKPDIVHSHTLNGLTADVWRSARSLNIPVVHTLHDYYLLCPRCSRFKGDHSCETTCGSCRALTVHRRERTRKVGVVVGVSQRTLDLHLREEVFSDTPIKRVVRNVANPAIHALPLPGRDGAGIKVGYLGRFSIEKGVRLLVEAVARLPAGSVRLFLAGTVSEQEIAYLRSLAPMADLSFVGFVDPSTFYTQVEMIAVPSIWEEPSSLALVDALAAGKPILSTGYGGMAEAIEDGVNGWIVEPTPEAFAAVLGRLAAEPNLIKAAHTALIETAHRRTFPDLVQEYCDIYSEALVLPH